MAACRLLPLLLPSLLLVTTAAVATGAHDCSTVHYETENDHHHNINLNELQLIGCRRIRRSSENPVSNNNTTQNVVPETTKPVVVNVSTAVIPIVKSNESLAIITMPASNITTTPPVVSNNATTANSTTQKPDAALLQKHNLGENGTGIHKYKECDVSGKNLNATLICVSDPIVPDDGYQDISEYQEPQEKLFKDHNYTSKQDSHEYYNSTLENNMALFNKYWDSLYKGGNIKTHNLLSNSHRRAVTINLSFDFPFYGHKIKVVTVASGGFVNTGEYIHNWLAATQYIAPLMANFDTTLHPDSLVKYYDNGTAFTVIWENVSLQDQKEPNTSNQRFTFACTLFDTGNIIFAYKNLPIVISNIKDESHPFKIGVSDAFIIDRVMVLVRRKTIFEYHKIDLRTQPISNGTLIFLTALPTCRQYNSCESCIKHNTAFECAWCDGAQLCSNGEDRNRQLWVGHRCDFSGMANSANCSSNSVNDKQSNVSNIIPKTASSNASVPSAKSSEGGSSAGAIVTSLCVLLVLGSIATWLLYAYRNPHTNSGQLLVKYRPSQWRWTRGEARYTPATIHM